MFHQPVERRDDLAGDLGLLLERRVAGEERRLGVDLPARRLQEPLDRCLSLRDPLSLLPTITAHDYARVRPLSPSKYFGSTVFRRNICKLKPFSRKAFFGLTRRSHHI